MAERNPECNHADDAGREVPAGFVRLERRGPEARVQAGCALILAFLLLAVCSGALTLLIYKTEGKGDPLVLSVLGLFALVGAMLLLAGVRGMRGAAVPAMEMFLLGGEAVLALGDGARLRFRQPGPVRFKSLRLTLLCERIYRRQVRKGSSGSVEDRERLVDQTIHESREERIGKGQILDREVRFVVPLEVPPTGPAAVEGTICWTIEVLGEAGLLRAIHHPFEISVVPSRRPRPSAGLVEEKGI